MTKRKIELRDGRVVVFGAMTCEALRSKAEEVEAVIGSVPVIAIWTMTQTTRSTMGQFPRPLLQHRVVVSIHRLFVRLDMGDGTTYDLIPEQCPDLDVEFRARH